MKYKITKEQCADNIKGVCSNCGGELEPLETVDNAGDPTFWSGCASCCKFDYGVDHKIYATAKKLVEEGYRHYSHITEDSRDDDERRLHKKQCQISGTCVLVRDVLRIHGSS